MYSVTVRYHNKIAIPITQTYTVGSLHELDKLVAWSINTPGVSVDWDNLEPMYADDIIKRVQRAM